MGRRKYKAPHRSSLGYRRKRASSALPKVRAWPKYTGAPRLLGFPTFKAGMTHVVVKEERQTSHLRNQEMITPVTVLEAPPVILLGIRGYVRTPYGLKIKADIWGTSPDKYLERRIKIAKETNLEKQIENFKAHLNEYAQIRAIVHTQPSQTGIGMKRPTLHEITIGAETPEKAFEYALEKLGSELNIEDFTNTGEFVDVIGITKGKGFQGAVKRHGVRILQHKTKHTKRGVGSIGAWHPARVSWTIARYGQLGYFRRTEYNKLVIQIGSDGKEVTPNGGFVKYGEVKNKYILVKGSVPGAKKRIVMLRKAIRPKVEGKKPNVLYLSTVSQN